MTVRVLVTCPPALASPDRYLERFGAAGIEVVLAEVVQQLTEDELIDLLSNINVIVAGDDPLTRRVMEQAPRLRHIARWGVGIDNVDLEAAAALGIRVTNTPGAFGDEVADVAIGYVILLARQLHRIDSSVRDGGWAKPRGQSLAGKTIGILGLGWIGRAVARRAMAMGMVPIGHDVAPAAADAAATEGVRIVDIAELLTESDILVLCSALTDSSRHVMDAAAFAQMRTGAWLVNVSRGGLVDESALTAALASGQIGRAAVDVLESEPMAPSNPLLEFDQVIFGSHNASNTEEAVARVNDLVIDHVLEGLGVVGA